MKLTAAPFLLSALFTAGAWAQAPQKIGVLSMQDALIQTKDGKQQMANLRAKFGPKDQDLQKRGQELQAKQDQYRKTQSTISPEAKAALEREIDGMTRSIQRDTDDAKQDLDQDQQAMFADVGGKLQQVVLKFAADNQYSLVFDISLQPNSILFATTAVDITNEIIAQYDKTAPASGSPEAARAPSTLRPAARPPAGAPSVPARKPPVGTPSPAK